MEQANLYDGDTGGTEYKGDGSILFPLVPLAVVVLCYPADNAGKMKKHTLHGAVILSNGCAHVFPYPTGGGKSTLTVYLYKRGLHAWTDDRVEIDYDTLAGMPRADDGELPCGRPYS